MGELHLRLNGSACAGNIEEVILSRRKGKEQAELEASPSRRQAAEGNRALALREAQAIMRRYVEEPDKLRGGSLPEAHTKTSLEASSTQDKAIWHATLASWTSRVARASEELAADVAPGGYHRTPSPSSAIQ